MKTYSKKIMQGAENNSFLFKRTLLAMSLLIKENNNDCEYFKAWVISNYYSKFKNEINYVFNLDFNKDKSEYSIASHLAKKIEYDYQRQLAKNNVAV